MNISFAGACVVVAQSLAKSTLCSPILFHNPKTTFPSLSKKKTIEVWSMARTTAIRGADTRANSTAVAPLGSDVKVPRRFLRSFNTSVDPPSPKLRPGPARWNRGSGAKSPKETFSMKSGG